MNILYIGDVMALPGQRALQQVLPALKQQFKIDFVIAQAENSDPEGKGPSKQDISNMRTAGVDFFTGGNHSLRGQHSLDVYADETVPITRPANIKNASGHGWRIVDTSQGKILIVSMLGQTVGRRHLELSNPLAEIDSILEQTKNEAVAARIVNFHGDFSSEKRVFGYYLDGRVSAVIGDHWHVPTADAMILPQGTAHITDVGMCGTLHSSLGVKTSVIVERWKTGKSSRNEIEQNGPLQFNAVLLSINEKTGLANNIEQIQRTL